MEQFEGPVAVVTCAASAVGRALDDRSAAEGMQTSPSPRREVCDERP